MAAEYARGAHTSLVVEESQRDRLAIGAVLELEYRARAVTAQVAGKVEIRRLEDVGRREPYPL